jgi:hypothetical protein
MSPPAVVLLLSLSLFAWHIHACTQRAFCDHNERQIGRASTRFQMQFLEGIQYSPFIYHFYTMQPDGTLTSTRQFGPFLVKSTYTLSCPFPSTSFTPGKHLSVPLYINCPFFLEINFLPSRKGCTVVRAPYIKRTVSSVNHNKTPHGNECAVPP